MTTTHVAHDPYARWTLHRESVAGDGSGCQWCGRRPHTLYRYAGESDAVWRCPTIRPGPAFCGLDCYRAYTV